MAAVASSSPSSDSRHSATQPVQPKGEVEDVTTNNGVFDVFEKNPDSTPQHFQPPIVATYHRRLRKDKAMKVYKRRTRDKK